VLWHRLIVIIEGKFPIRIWIMKLTAMGLYRIILRMIADGERCEPFTKMLLPVLLCVSDLLFISKAQLQMFQIAEARLRLDLGVSLFLRNLRHAPQSWAAP